MWRRLSAGSEVAAAGFPLPLPAGYAFPADTDLQAGPGFDCGVEDGTYCEAGFGLTEAFCSGPARPRPPRSRRMSATIAASAGDA